jgi:hypothetical protein
VGSGLGGRRSLWIKPLGICSEVRQYFNFVTYRFSLLFSITLSLSFSSLSHITPVFEVNRGIV